MVTPQFSSESQALTSVELLLVRVGLHGQVGRFGVLDSQAWCRRDRVVCRTSRGIEVGEILGKVEASSGSAAQIDGRVLRRMRAEDELLWGHLRHLSREAHTQCDAWLKAHGFQHTLLDVEPLLDGRTLYFHFLSSVEDPIEKYVEGLVRVYEEQGAGSEFASLLERGCGPGCGTEQAENGCGSRGACSVCSISAACRSTN